MTRTTTALVTALALLAGACSADDPVRPTPDPGRATPAPRATTITGATATPHDPLPPTGDPYSLAYGANALGVIVGASRTSGGDLAAVAWQPGGVVDRLTNPALGGTAWDAKAINALGQIIGGAMVNGEYRMMLWPQVASVPVDLTAYVPGKPHLSQAMSINSRGQVVGYFVPPDLPNPVCFVWSPSTPNGSSGTLTLLLPVTTECVAEDINTAGQITGLFGTSAGAVHAFLWTPSVANGATGTMLDLTPADVEAEGAAVNDAGQVAGRRIGASSPGGRQTAFVWTPPSCGATSGAIADLGDFAGNPTLATDLSDAGYVVGYSRDPATGAARAFFWQDGAFTPLPGPAGTFSTAPSAITSTNLVVGTTRYAPSSYAYEAGRWQVTPGTGTAAQAGVDALRALVTDMRDQQHSLTNGAAQSILAKLDAAVRQLAHPCSPAPANLLRAVVTEVETLVASGRLTSTQAKPLLDGARALIGTL